MRIVCLILSAIFLLGCGSESPDADLGISIPTEPEVEGYDFRLNQGGQLKIPYEYQLADNQAYMNIVNQLSETELILIEPPENDPDYHQQIYIFIDTLDPLNFIRFKRLNYFRIDEENSTGAATSLGSSAVGDFKIMGFTWERTECVLEETGWFNYLRIKYTTTGYDGSIRYETWYALTKNSKTVVIQFSNTTGEDYDAYVRTFK